MKKNQQRTSERSQKLPSKFKDHVMDNQSKKRDGKSKVDLEEEETVNRRGNSMISKECNVSPSEPCLDEVISNGEDSVTRNRDDEDHFTGPDPYVFNTIVDVEGAFQVSLATVDELVAFSKDVTSYKYPITLTSESWVAIRDIVDNRYQELLKCASNTKVVADKIIESAEITSQRSNAAESTSVGPAEATGTNSLGNEQDAGPKVTTFASVVKPNNNKVVQITELRNDEHVEGAAVTLPLSAIEEVSSRFTNTLYGYFVGKRLDFRSVEKYVHNTWAKFGIKRIQLHGDFFLFQFENKEGMDRVLESGPWLIRMVPLILNVWSPDSDLHKAEIKKVPVWVKLHHVPLVAYSEVGLSLITTQIGKPIRLDTYTSNMCLNSWGRSAYARALIELSAEEPLKEDLVIAIPVGKDKGHSLVTIKIEYEWCPPRCATCLIFDHVSDKCPKLPKVVSSAVVNDVIEDAAKHLNGTTDDGFDIVKKKRNRKKKHQKQVDGVILSKPSLNLHYRRVDKNNSTKQSVASTSKVCSTSTGVQDKIVRLENSFSALNDDEERDLNDNTTWKNTQQALNVINESDSDADEEITLDDRGGTLKTT